MKYVKPVFEITEDTAEGVYMASGSTCYVVDAYIHQTPEFGRDDYRIQVNAKHNADHTCNEQELTLNFNQPVNYLHSNGVCVGNNGTNTLVIRYNYWNNPKDNIGLGDVVVSSDPGLKIVSAHMDDGK